MAHRGRHNADDGLALILAGGATVRAAATRANLSERTVYRRLEDPTFTARVHQLRSEMLDRSCGRLARLMSRAACRLRKLLDSEDEKVALGACRVVMDSGLKVREAAELEQRLRTLEDRLNQSKKV